MLVLAEVSFFTYCNSATVFHFVVIASNVKHGLCRNEIILWSHPVFCNFWRDVSWGLKIISRIPPRQKGWRKLFYIFKDWRKCYRISEALVTISSEVVSVHTTWEPCCVSFMSILQTLKCCCFFKKQTINSKSCLTADNSSDVIYKWHKYVEKGNGKQNMAARSGDHVLKFPPCYSIL